METQRAKELTQALMRATGDWSSAVDRAAHDLLPDTPHWAINGNQGEGFEILATDKGALYSLVLSGDQNDSSVMVRRLPITGASWQAAVTERIATNADGYWRQQRRWSFLLAGAEELALETDQGLEDTELHSLERFARTLAGAIGWGQFSEADGDE